MSRLIFALFTMPLLLIETSWSSERSLTPWVIVNFFSYPLIVAASIAVHEAGHAVVARSLGISVLAEATASLAGLQRAS